jgi:protein-tyrosine phosphatase
MAAAILQRSLHDRFNEKDRPSIIIRTAGMAALNGMPASEEACLIMRELGFNIDQHRTTRLTAELIEQTDLILTMTDHQCHVLREEFPHKATMIYSLAKISGPGFKDVLDPFGREPEAYRQTCQQLKQMVDRLVDKIIESK